MKPVVSIVFFFVTVCFGQDEKAVRLPTDPPLKGAKQMELGAEYTVLVSYENNDQFLIRMPSRKQPLHIYITPCNKPVHWNLRIPNHYALEPSIHPLSKHFNKVLHMRIPPLIEFTEDLHSREKLVLLAGEENNERMKFFTHSVDADYLVLNMSSNRQTSAKVFATTLESQINAFYPRLPKDTSVTFSINRSKINNELFDLNLEWPVPDYLTGEKAKEYRFCVLVSKHQPQYSICEESSEDLESMHCVPSNMSKLILSGLESSERYYVTLFIHSLVSGASSAYTPIEFRTPTNPSRTESPKPSTSASESKVGKRKLFQKQPVKTFDLQFQLQQLNDAALMKHQVEFSSNNNYLYRLPSTVRETKNVELVLQTCNGYVRLAIYKNGELLRKTGDFIGLERFLIAGVAPGDQLRIQILNDDKSAVQYWIWCGADYKLSPFVDMPIDRTIRVMKRYCNHIVLQFSRASNDDNNIRYCIHEKETAEDYFRDIINEPARMCWSELPIGRQAVCFRQNETEPITQYYPQDSQAMQFTITSLKPSTTYRLDVSAQNNQKNSQPVAFRTLFVRTKDHC
ncbi:NDNF-C domain-containing protein [Aphelenchoides bicaudatus]|nr:NDNF-C domain-containing protein [Aphelenchoides bicaudatus]